MIVYSSHLALKVQGRNIFPLLSLFHLARIDLRHYEHKSISYLVR